MKHRMLWFEEQWKYRGFRILAAVTAVISIMLCLEFGLLRNGILKILCYLTVLWGLSAAAWTDYRTRKIPNQLLLCLLRFRMSIMVLECIVCPESWLMILTKAFHGTLTGGGVLLVCFLMTGGGIGAGDVKLFAVTGFCMGSKAAMEIMLYTMIDAAVCIGIMLLMGKTGLKRGIPLAPFVLCGAAAFMVLGG